MKDINSTSTAAPALFSLFTIDATLRKTMQYAASDFSDITTAALGNFGHAVMNGNNRYTAAVILDTSTSTARAPQNASEIARYILTAPALLAKTEKAQKTAAALLDRTNAAPVMREERNAAAALASYEEKVTRAASTARRHAAFYKTKLGLLDKERMDARYTTALAIKASRARARAAHDVLTGLQKDAPALLALMGDIRRNSNAGTRVILAALGFTGLYETAASLLTIISTASAESLLALYKPAEHGPRPYYGHKENGQLDGTVKYYIEDYSRNPEPEDLPRLLASLDALKEDLQEEYRQHRARTAMLDYEHGDKEKEIRHKARRARAVMDFYNARAARIEEGTRANAAFLTANLDAIRAHPEYKHAAARAARFEDIRNFYDIILIAAYTFNAIKSYDFTVRGTTARALAAKETNAPARAAVIMADRAAAPTKEPAANRVKDTYIFKDVITTDSNGNTATTPRPVTMASDERRAALTSAPLAGILDKIHGERRRTKTAYHPDNLKAAITRGEKYLTTLPPRSMAAAAFSGNDIAIDLYSNIKARAIELLRHGTCARYDARRHENVLTDIRSALINDTQEEYNRLYFSNRYGFIEPRESIALEEKVLNRIEDGNGEDAPTMADLLDDTHAAHGPADNADATQPDTTAAAQAHRAAVITRIMELCAQYRFKPRNILACIYTDEDGNPVLDESKAAYYHARRLEMDATRNAADSTTAPADAPKEGPDFRKIYRASLRYGLNTGYLTDYIDTTHDNRAELDRIAARLAFYRENPAELDAITKARDAYQARATSLTAYAQQERENAEKARAPIMELKATLHGISTGDIMTARAAITSARAALAHIGIMKIGESNAIAQYENHAAALAKTGKEGRSRAAAYLWRNRKANRAHLATLKTLQQEESTARASILSNTLFLSMNRKKAQETDTRAASLTHDINRYNHIAAQHENNAARAASLIKFWYNAADTLTVDLPQALKARAALLLDSNTAARAHLNTILAAYLQEEEKHKESTQQRAATLKALREWAEKVIAGDLPKDSTPTTPAPVTPEDMRKALTRAERRAIKAQQEKEPDAIQEEINALRAKSKQAQKKARLLYKAQQIKQDLRQFKKDLRQFQRETGKTTNAAFNQRRARIAARLATVKKQWQALKEEGTPATATAK